MQTSRQCDLLGRIGQIKNLVDESLGFSSTRLALIHLIRRLQRTSKHGLNAKHAR